MYHHGMTVPYERTGRVSQKARTRDALVTAAREILAEGASPTMEAVAARAAISRTTAYRYFPSARWLLTAAYPHIDRPSLLDAGAPSDPQSRLAIVVDDHMRRILEHEAEQRAVLRLSLETGRANPLDLPMHRAMRIDWLQDALAPLRGRIPDDALDALVLGIGATIGIEAFVWLTDVAERSREDAVEIMRANAMALLHTALAALPENAA
jgi:AcrR family transcriptional regulator